MIRSCLYWRRGCAWPSDQQCAAISNRLPVSKPHLECQELNSLLVRYMNFILPAYVKLAVFTM